MPSTAARLAAGAALAGLALSPLFLALPRHHAASAPPRGNALVAFEPNAGRGPADVDFYARLGSGTVAISPQRTRLSVAGGLTLTTKLVGARAAAPSTWQPLTLRVNSYLSRDPSKWRTGLPTFGGVDYASVYPGIDLRYHGRGTQLEYDFVVKPGADPRRILLDMSGAGRLRLDHRGNLVAGRGIRQLRPLAYQDIAGSRRPVSARFTVDGRRVRFALGEYDRSRPLVIDPVLAFSDILTSKTNGGFNDTAYDVAVDPAGNAYVVGRTWGDGSIPPGDPTRTAAAGFVLKIAPDGSRPWITYVANSLITDVALSAIGGDPYVAGQGFSSMPVHNAAQSTFGGGTSDAMVGRLGAGDGTVNWLTYFGGTQYDATDYRGIGIAVDRDGNAYVGGDTGSASLFNGQGTYDTTQSGTDGFVVEYGPTGTRGKGTYFGGTYEDNISAITVDPSCQNTCPVFVGGSTNSDSDFPVLNGSQSYGGTQDAFAAKLKGDLSNRDWATFYGGGDVDYVRAIAVNSLGWPTIAGGRDWTGAPGNTEQAYIQSYDARNWSKTYEKVFVGNGDDEVSDMVYAGSNNFYLVGWTASTDFLTVDAIQDHAAGSTDAFVVRLNENFTASNPILWSTYLGGGNGDHGYGVAVGQNGDVWAVGQTISNDFPKVANKQSGLGGFVSTIALDPVSIDSGPDGTLRSHSAAFTYSSAIPNAAYGCRLTPMESSFGSCPNTGKTYSDVPDGDYTFEVRATDVGGSTGRPVSRSFKVDSRPAAVLTVAPSPALVGRTVTFDASKSTAAGGVTLTKFEWDLDGDGNFERDTGDASTTTDTYSSARSNQATVRVTDSQGLQATASAQLTVTAPPPLGSQFGVTIDNGAQFTRTPNVTVTANFPATTTSMLFSNDGGFLAPTVFPPTKSVKWKLDSSGPERLPKQIYVRFLAGTIPSETFQDDIILDEIPPVVQQAIVSPAAGSAAASTATAAAQRKWKVRVKAKDSNSGVARIQVTANKKKPGKLLAYKRRLTVKSARRPKWVRARDRAGNYSRWRAAR